MSQLIIYTTENGNVAVTVPTGELPINEVLTKDCPDHAIIIDDSELPQGADAQFFDAWELVNGKIVVNEIKKQAIIDAQTTATTAKQTALTKLAALGLTADEVKALIG
jgi:hypothetical protein